MNLTLITHAIAALTAAGAVWVFQDARWAADVADIRLSQADEQSAAVSRARAEERAINKTYQEALNAARTREALLRRDADRARAESDSLRAQLSDAARRIADAPPAAVAEYATTVGELLAVCSRERTFYAEKADGHASDVRTLIEAWPVNLTSSDDKQ
jgi:septal ring factor EnvC (AmiA/AmiB activator)